MNNRRAHARRALEHVCARGDLEATRQRYAADFVDHGNPLEFRGTKGIAGSVALYRAVFPDVAIPSWTTPRSSSNSAHDARSRSPRAG